MSRARKCDICGKLYEDYLINTKGKLRIESENVNAIMFICKDLNNKHNSNTTIDCCGGCLNSIINHIVNLKEQNNETN